MTKNALAAFLICSVASLALASGASAAGAGEGEWVRHAQASNGDVHFFDSSRVEKSQNLRKVWNRIRYKSSVMGASSYESLLEIDCSAQTARKLRSTFFSDKQWEKPAMAPDMKEKPKRRIVAGSPEEKLSEILCDR